MTISPRLRTGGRRRGRYGRITAVAGALSALAVLAACSGPPNGPSDSSDSFFALSPGTPGAAGPIDSFSWAVYAEPPTLDYTVAFDYPQNTILSNVCESLMRWTPGLTIEPGLARKESHPDPTTWVYDLREGVRFHDGRTMSADDVVHSLGRQRNPDNAAAWAQVFQNVTAITRTGPLQVTVKLKKPDSQFPQYMATAAGVVASKAGVEKAGRDYGTTGGLACSGPFELGTWRKGQSIELDRFDAYWGAKAKAGKAEFRFLTDPSARTNALLSGEVDGGYLIPTESYARLGRSVTGTLYFGEGLSTVNVNVTNLKGPLGDVRVRRALSLALDRSGFVRAGLGEAGGATTSLTTRAAWARASHSTRKAAFDGLAPTEPDLEKARALIKEAGASGATLTVATSSIGQDVSLLATAVQAAGTQIGLDIRLKSIAPNAFTALFTDPGAREGIDMFPLTYYQSITDPLDLLANFRTGAYLNFAGYSDKSYDELVDRATAAHDPEQRMKAETKLQHHAADRLLWIPVAEWPTSVFLNQRITGAPTTIAYLYYPWAADVGAAP
ncbi:ABC transporter substrate-binding protein [Streptomyces anulatus]|uniref:ABC transporter substrate-binding protein n=1 Tax=Streptomyces anulatus TaxID=1892 RepID=UPI001C605C8E|nr:ABC transporter substrate-binding protein [Streptomyces anulatus]QYA92794.1 ABC transporter substrate-binding protein [Streptomyces anulatus]WSW81499.1 ABC transporter substrate-binding protein [Streptomyces anulatus]